VYGDDCCLTGDADEDKIDWAEGRGGLKGFAAGVAEVECFNSDFT